MEDLESIYRQYADTVFRFLMSRTGSAELSEELTQETFYQAVKSIGRYDGSSQVSSWLCGIAKNVLYASLRSRQKDPLPMESLPEGKTASAEDLIVSREETETILHAIRGCPDPGGEILRLRIFGGLSFRQIGAVLGHTETWARVNYYRAKQTIVKELKDDDE